MSRVETSVDSPLRRSIGPVAVQVTATEILLADLTDAKRGAGLLAVANLGPNTIFLTFSPSATSKPGLTTTNGFPIGPNGFVIFDRIGGLAVWARCSVLQVAPADTRVCGAKV